MLRTFIDTTVEDSRWESPLVDEDWHATCQPIYKGVEEAEWENMYYKYVGLHQAVHLEKLRVQRRQGRCG